MARPKPTFGPQVLKRIFLVGAFDPSPDAHTLAYTTNKSGLWSVHALDVRTGRDRQLVRMKQASLSPGFSPDGRWVAFHSDFNGDENFDVFVIPAKGGRPRNLTKHPADDRGPMWSPDGRWIAFTSNRVADVDNLYVIPSKGGGPRRLTDHEETVTEFAWRPDGGALVYSLGVGDNKTVRLVDLDGRDRLVLGRPNVEYELTGDVADPQPFSPDGTRLAFASSEKDVQDVGIVDLATGAMRWLPPPSWERSSPAWSPDGQEVAFVENVDGNFVIRAWSLQSGRIRAISPEQGVAYRPHWLPDGRLAFLYSEARRPMEIWIADGRARRLTRSVRTRLPTARLVRPTLVRYPSVDGREIPAWLYVPQNRKRAAVVYIHGGPEAQSLNNFSAAIQFTASRGYVVIAPNYRGGTGYGRSFKKLSDRDLGGGDRRDCVHAAKYLVDRGLAARDRIGAFGGSYGGYLAMHTLTQDPDVWAAGVVICGFFNWATEIANERGFLKQWDHQKMGDPEKEPEFFAARSPIYFLDRLRAPTLMIHGALDPRCPVEEAHQVRDKLRGSGKTLVYHEYPDEGHSPRRLPNLIDMYTRCLAFLDEYLPVA
ncbi:MAG: S9 family peptidase [Euryarchaeota archaeon]|nr:S9 family peptidase [Euryarchaeota archaeon]